MSTTDDDPWDAPGDRPPASGRDKAAALVGAVEMVLGVAASFGGCIYAIDLPPLPLCGMALGWGIPLLFVTLPGLALLTRARFALVLQILPLMFAVLLAERFLWPVLGPG